MSNSKLREQALEYHLKGKIALKSTKPCNTQDDLSLAYTPGVAQPCLEIEKFPEKSWVYTARGNQVAVISDGTAVLGLGNIGATAAMPVMEGKCVLFKSFANIDAFPLCLEKVCTADGRSDAKKIIESVERLGPSFGGINLEDIAAPECFEIESTLKKTMQIPVFHDDQHGTAIISLAGILNAIELAGKKIEDCKFVINGAGAAGIACSEFYILAGARRENFLMCDSKGVISKKRSDIKGAKANFAASTDAVTLADAMHGADVFVGVSVADAVSREMAASMNDKAIIFAMANPTPEIFPADALAAGAFVVGTGRTDFPNQVNNVLGFPGIFRGALDVRASDINDEMKLAAARALAAIVREPVDDKTLKILSEAYPLDAASGMFTGSCPLKKDFVIPKPFDPRVVPKVARFVAAAAMKSGVAQVMIDDLDEYERQCAQNITKSKQQPVAK